MAQGRKHRKYSKNWVFRENKKSITNTKKKEDSSLFYRSSDGGKTTETGEKLCGTFHQGREKTRSF